MEISITGGSGFIGRLLVQNHLRHGDKVRVLSRRSYPSQSNLQIIQGDLLDSTSNLEEFVQGADVLYHCAAELHDKSVMHELHIEGTKRLAAVASSKIGRWVQLSSVGAYGPCRFDVVNESTPENPVGIYEKTKADADRILIEKAASDKMDLVILRPSIVFGEKMTNHSLAQLVKIIQRGLFFYIGSSGAIVNYVHVDDVVRALLKCATHKNAVGNTYILSQSIALEEMINALSKGINVQTPSLRMPEFVALFIAATLGKLPKFPLTKSRLNALTGRCRYEALSICNDLDFTFQELLVPAFEHYAASLDLN